MVERDEPLITFYVNSYNRLSALKNLLRSFDLTNAYAKVEWVVTDYGSTDGAREYLQQFARDANFPVKLIFGHEKDYFVSIREYGLRIDSRWARFRAILAHYRNEARKAAEGDLFFDVGEDHQFIRRDNWVAEVLAIFRHRADVVGRDDIAGIVPYGYLMSRLKKPNNSRHREVARSGLAYFVARQKDYVDYSIMKRVTAERVGPFLEPTNMLRGSWEWQAWQDENAEVQPEADYARRCTRLGLKRVLMKYPVTVSLPNDSAGKFQNSDQSLLASLWTRDDLERHFGRWRRPVSSDELLKSAVRAP